MDRFEVSFIRSVVKINGIDRSAIQNAQEKVRCFYWSGIASDQSGTRFDKYCA
jgi:hypothetical protein